MRYGSLEGRASLWEECVRLHGHACEELAAGFQAAMLAIEALEIEDGDEIVCVSEGQTCAVDAIQALLGATAGNGGLRLASRGKRALSIYNLTSGRSCRILPKTLPLQPLDGMIDYILGAKAIDLFEIKPVLSDPPVPEERHATAQCAECGETVAEPYLRLRAGRWLCVDCLSAQ